MSFRIASDPPPVTVCKIVMLNDRENFFSVLGCENLIVPPDVV
jgi:hypothetical protein